MDGWMDGRVAYQIWYIEDGSGRAAALPWPIVAVLNVQQSTGL